MNERIIPDADLSDLKGEITFGPFSNPRLNAVLKHFGKTAFGRSSACMEFESFLRQIAVGATGHGLSMPLATHAFQAGDDGRLVEDLKIGKTCLEIGTFHGITAVVLSQFFDQVLCVSVDDPNAKLLKEDIIHFLGIKNIAFHDARDNAEKAAFIKAATFDFCYQDGDHTNDTPADFALVKHCGRVLFHEFWPLQPPVWNLVNSLPQHEVTRAQFDCLAYWEAGRKVAITVNGAPHQVAGTGISYEDVMALIGQDPERIFSMTYRTRRGGDEQREGILFPGRAVKLEDGMSFDAGDTSNA